jgi:hypothetical protein
MTMERKAKKRLGWAAKGEPQFIDNPVRLGLARRAGTGDFESGQAYIAGRRKAGTTETPARKTKLVEQRITNRTKGYRG